MSIRYLTLEEILILHAYQIETFGGSSGLKDSGLLESAVLRLRATFDGIDLYSDVFEKAAVLISSIIKNHPFVDGNKRTGAHAALTFLELNGFVSNFDTETLVTLCVDIASGSANVQQVTKMLENKSKRYKNI